MGLMLEVEAQGGAREGRLGGGDLRTSLALCIGARGNSPCELGENPGRYVVSNTLIYEEYKTDYQKNANHESSKKTPPHRHSQAAPSGSSPPSQSSSPFN